MTYIISRRKFLCLSAGGIAGVSLGGYPAFAQSRTLHSIYPVALPTYQTLFVAQRKGFFKDEGLDVKLTMGGSGSKMREIVAAGDGDVGIGDVTHPLQLANHNRPAKILSTVDTRAGGILIVGTEPRAHGATDLGKLAAYKRPDGRKPIIGVSSLGGTSHVWASYFLEQMKLDRAFTFLGLGDTASMLGALKTKQIDCLALSISAQREAEKQGWGQALFDQASSANWDKYVGGKVPVTVNFALQSTIERDPARMQAFINATHRAAGWIAEHSAEEIYEQIEPFVGATSRESNLAEIDAGKALTDTDGRIDEASYARGAKVYFREMTRIKPIPLEKIYAGEFIARANAKAPS